MGGGQVLHRIFGKAFERVNILILLYTPSSSCGEEESIIAIMIARLENVQQHQQPLAAAHKVAGSDRQYI